MTLRHHEPRTVGEVVGRAAFALVLLAAAIIVPIAVVHATRHPGPPAQAAVVPPTVTTPATVAVSRAAARDVFGGGDAPPRGRGNEREPRGAAPASRSRRRSVDAA